MLESPACIYFLSAVLATYVWRFSAVMISHRIEANHPIFEWFTCLAYGIIAALVARTLILPTGLLALLPLWHRLIAMALAFLGFYLFGKRLWVGIVFGETGFIVLLWFNGIHTIGV
jgi:branched-subunit amino acid transport protein